jgi:hypothetical protein
MANDLVPSGGSKPHKFTFWDKPEGTLGMVVAAALAIAGGMGLYHVLPFIVSLLSNIFTAALLILTIGVMFYALVLDDSLRKFLGLRYKLLMKALTYSVIKEDPALFLRYTQEVDQKRLDQINKNLTSAGTGLKVLETNMQDYSRQGDKIRREYEQIKKMPNASQLDLTNRAMKIKQLKDAYDELQRPFANMTRIMEGMKKARDYQIVKLDQIAFQIDLKIQRAKVINSLASSTRLFRNFLTGRDDNSIMQQEALTFMDEDYTEKAGYIDTFLEDSQKLFDEQDLQKAIMTAEGQELLEGLASSQVMQLPQLQPVSR